MATNRGIVLATSYVYHIYNRGVERRHIFGNAREYGRFLDIMHYYQHANPALRYSKFLQQPTDVRTGIFEALMAEPTIVDILSFCLMPNHFHLLIRQQSEGGISRFLANICNSYTKYFNTKHARVGPLLQGTFKAVLVETDEQLVHVSRYIHLNPVSSLIIPKEKLNEYLWSSFPEYLGMRPGFTSTDTVLSYFPSREHYHNFVSDQADYAKTLERTKHLCFEE